MTRIDDMEARANAATQGPWKLWGMSVMADPVGNSNLDDAIDVAATHMLIDGKPRTFDAEFIAQARQDIPDLVAFVREVESNHTQSGTTCDWCDFAWPCPDRQALDRLNGEAARG